jgi:DtxR family Mn-dependent transcriptional regulator
MLTFAEENYLKAIYHLSQGGRNTVTTNAISDQLNTRPASVSDMIRKLAEKGVLEYEKYRGVNVSEQGKLLALRVIRKHRLWEVFLVQELKFNWDEVHEVAEELEHINSPLLIKRLDEYLGSPAFDPHGDPIPTEDGEIRSAPRMVLSEMHTGDRGKLVAVKDTGALFLQYLDKVKITLGDTITVKEKIEYDGSMEIALDGKGTRAISKEVAKNLWISE